MHCPSTRGALHKLRMIKRLVSVARDELTFVLECAVCGGRMKLITDVAFASELGLELPIPAAT